MHHEIEIKDYRPEQFIKTISEQLSLDFEHEGREYCTSLANIYGHGYIRAYDFDHGLSVIEFDCTLQQVFRFTFKKNEVQPLKILFNREENIVLKRDDDSKEIQHLECFMNCDGLKMESTLEIPKNQSSCFLMLLINRKLFEEKIGDFVASMNKDLEDIFRDNNGVNAYFENWYYSLDISKYMEEFTSCEHTNFMKHVYLEGKSYEILTHFFRQYLDDLQEPENRTILRQSTIEKIEEASQIIENELESLGSILSIAKKVRLNQNTLQEGFRHHYKKSVNQYIKDMRLEKAKDLMENGDLNITEITYKLGINSRSYFSKIFKERYGMTPKDYISLRRKRSNSNLTG